MTIHSKKMMNIQLNKETAEKVEEVAKSMGMTTDEVVNKILQWYFEDCEK